MARVLVVDDYEDTRVLVGILLEHVGHEVLTADNGLQAIALARAYHPDAIVMSSTVVNATSTPTSHSRMRSLRPSIVSACFPAFSAR